MTAAHTPGPWEPCILNKPLDQISNYVEQCIAASSGGDFYFVSGIHQEDGGAVDVCHVGNGPRGLSNARLIAAAPDLLEALKYVMSAHGEQLTSAFGQAQDAIFKATGETT